jgi:anti-sigma factor RsiW
MTAQSKPGVRRWLKGLMLKHMHGMISCREFEDFVLGYLEGELPERQRSMFDRHLRICRECREYLAAYRRAIDVGRALLPSPDDPVPDEVPEDLIKAILESRRQ